MIRRVIGDESGMTMGLTVIMVVLIGVMGAGLLTFVQNDLSTVIESNQGQTAFNLADAGTQAAKRHLLVDANTFNYDGNNATGTAPGGESPWSCKPNPSNVCTGTGKTIDLGTGNLATVWIQYLQPSTTTAQLELRTHAPELVTSGTNYEFGKDYFRVLSEGTAGNAKRKVEAIYQTYDLGTPRAYFAQGNIAIRGDASVENISIFSLLSVDIGGDTTDKVIGEDLAYGSWLNPPFNTTARSTNAAGIGAVGTITPSNRMQAGPPRQDFDSTMTSPTPRFFKKTDPVNDTQTTSQITFPFNYQRKPDIEMMRAAAKLQDNGTGGDNYYEVAPSSTTGLQGAWETGAPAGDPDWPANSDISTVVFVSFTNAATNTTNRLTWSVDGTQANPLLTNECIAVENNLATPAKGTLVVENGNFRTQSQTLPLRGTVVVTSGTAPGASNLDRNNPPYYSYQDQGNACMQSFTHANGDIDIGGNPGAFTQERGNRPGFYGIRLWGWRECYSTTCN